MHQVDELSDHIHAAELKFKLQIQLATIDI
jgi:hypothetical protein